MIINRDRIDKWWMADITAGVTSETWSAEMYVSNVTNERAEMARNFVFDRTSVHYARPRTAGIRLGWKF